MPGFCDVDTFFKNQEVGEICGVVDFYDAGAVFFNRRVEEIPGVPTFCELGAFSAFLSRVAVFEKVRLVC